MRKLVFISAAIAICASVVMARERITSYVFMRGHTQIMSNVNLEHALTIRDLTGDHSLWFRMDGKAFVVRDATTLDEIDALFAATRALEPEYESLRQKRQPLEDREEELDREIDRIEERVDEISDDENATGSERDERGRLEDRMHELEREVRDVERRTRDFDEAEQQLDRKQDNLEKEAERAMEPVLERAIRNGIAKPF
jgi:hypothetical protein